VLEKWPLLARHVHAAARLRVWADTGRAARTIDAYARALAEYPTRASGLALTRSRRLERRSRPMCKN
jgi:hypothetical protein